MFELLVAPLHEVRGELTTAFERWASPTGMSRDTCPPATRPLPSRDPGPPQTPSVEATHVVPDTPPTS